MLAPLAPHTPPKQNYHLAGLPAVDYERCLPHLERVPLQLGRALYHAGVRREGVTEAAGHLQAAGLIHYRRDRISVLDRPKLEARVCECYAVVKQESDRLFSRNTAIVDQVS
jgi:hypothetical protein